MKDYRLSEIKNRDWHGKWEQENDSQTFSEIEFLRELQRRLEHRNIGPRDMIELPCKVEVKYAINCSNWQVVWRNRNGNGSLITKMFETESEADEFLAGLGGDIRNGL